MQQLLLQLLSVLHHLLALDASTLGHVLALLGHHLALLLLHQEGLLLGEASLAHLSRDAGSGAAGARILGTGVVGLGDERGIGVGIAAAGLLLPTTHLLHPRPSHPPLPPHHLLLPSHRRVPGMHACLPRTLPTRDPMALLIVLFWHVYVLRDPLSGLGAMLGKERLVYLLGLSGGKSLLLL